MNSVKRRLHEILRQTSLQARDQPVFRLASGKMSRFYVDCRKAMSDPEARALVGELFAERLNGLSIDAAGGLELGAYPLAIAVSDAIFRSTGQKIRAFVVRKEPKQHGIEGLLAGDAKPGDGALIVDDVVTTGASTIKAITGARQAGLVVDRVMVLIDRQEEEGAEKIKEHGVSFTSLFTLSDLTSPSESLLPQD